MKWFPSFPVPASSVIALVILTAIFALSVFAARLRRGRGDGAKDGARRSGKSWVGVMTQGFAMSLTGFGPVVIARGAGENWVVVHAAITVLLGGGAVALFIWASRTMGRNWSLVARTRSDHRLVTAGPFALMRHPIYTAMGLFMFGIATAFGHYWHLVAAIPIFARGTWLRIREEEALLRQAFGPEYAAYAERVRRFVPGLF